jgi:hypothetical protein
MLPSHPESAAHPCAMVLRTRTCTELLPVRRKCARRQKLTNGGKYGHSSSLSFTLCRTWLESLGSCQWILGLSPTLPIGTKGNVAAARQGRSVARKTFGAQNAGPVGNGMVRPAERLTASPSAPRLVFSTCPSGHSTAAIRGGAEGSKNSRVGGTQQDRSNGHAWTGEPSEFSGCFVHLLGIRASAVHAFDEPTLDPLSIASSSLVPPDRNRGPSQPVGFRRAVFSSVTA